MTPGEAEWEARVADFWEGADDARPEETLARMREVADARSGPEAVYEWASVHDFLGREAEAVPLYREALERGLGGDRRPQALIQLASSLRNLGRPEEAIEILEGMTPDAVVGAAPEAFLALALRDAGRPDEALRVALGALAPTLPLYGRAVRGYI